MRPRQYTITPKDVDREIMGMLDDAAVSRLNAEAMTTRSFVALSETIVGESFATLAVSSICGMEQISRSAAITICHLSVVRGYCKSIPTRNGDNILAKRSGGTGPLVTFLLVPPSGSCVCLSSNGSTRPQM